MEDALRRFKAGIFQGLAHPTRIAIVELLRDGELPVSKILERLDVEQANVSQHLAVLRARQIVANHKAGNQVFYRLRDPVLIEVLDIMKRYFQTHLSDALKMLRAFFESPNHRHLTRAEIESDPDFADLCSHEDFAVLLDKYLAETPVVAEPETVR